MKTQLVKNYLLNNCGKYYTISKQGRDVFYFNKESNFQGFPNQLNVNTEDFDDAFLKYCEEKMNNWYITDEQLEFYIIKYFNRLLNYKNKFDRYKIDEYLLDKNGKLSFLTLKYDKRHRKNIGRNVSNYFKLDTPYSENCDWYLFNMIVKSTTESETYKDVAELSRADFEKELSSDALKLEYVELYGDQNKFYFELIDDTEDFEYVKIVLYLIENDKVKFFFLKDNYN
jgi:hypothetical protein